MHPSGGIGRIRRVAVGDGADDDHALDDALASDDGDFDGQGFNLVTRRERRRSYRLLSAQSLEPAESEESVCTELPTEPTESVAVAVAAVEAVEEAERVPCEPGVARVPAAACVGD
ncbi:MAG: hypothetical protein M3Q72_08835 [Actinomycetota bacterium]|nr:hypothetical protein [Actinomycetota bacterium]